MAWTAPKTWLANSVLTAAELNTYLRDNLLECAPAIATTEGAFFVCNGVNNIDQRIPEKDFIATSESTAVTTYTNLATVGPSVTVNSGPRALAFWSAQLDNSGAALSRMTVEVSGATTNAASDSRMLANDGTSSQAMCQMVFFDDLNFGSNTFTCKYRASANTATFANRRLTVIPF